MKFILSAAAVVLALSSTAVLAKDVIVIDIDDSNNSNTHLRLDSEELGYSPSDLAIGESRTHVTEDGKTVVMTRTEEGLDINVDGEDLDLPPIPADAKHGHMGDHHKKMRHKMDDDSIAVISHGELTDDQIAAIKQAMVSAGFDESKVHVMDGSKKHRKHKGKHKEIRIIREEKTD